MDNIEEQKFLLEIRKVEGQEKNWKDELKIKIATSIINQKRLDSQNKYWLGAFALGIAVIIIAIIEIKCNKISGELISKTPPQTHTRGLEKCI